ncbi:hypothetical protein TNCV_1561691 [Trichonephila clavipes]|nr:hypothetical protein TNCV_1561691 [Trichonephila clavipes]
MTDVTSGANWEDSLATFKVPAPQVTSQKFPGVDLSRRKDHVVFRIHMIAGSRIHKVIRYYVPGKPT